MMQDEGLDPERGTAFRRHWMLGVGALAAAAGAGVAWWRLQPRLASSAASEGFWQQHFEQSTGESLPMARLRGKPLLLNFWATWCPPCVEELPMLDAFWREHATKGLQILALAIDQPSAVRRFLARQALSFPVALAGMEGTALAQSLGNAKGGLPFSVFFKADGSIYKQKLGQLSQEDLNAWLRNLG